MIEQAVKYLAMRAGWTMMSLLLDLPATRVSRRLFRYCALLYEWASE